MDSTTETSSATSATPEVPEGEAYVIHGKIVDSSSGGGGYSFSPGYTMYCIEAADGRKEWLTLTTYQSRKYPCWTCSSTPPANQASTYGRDHWVLVTSLHDHYVVRTLDEEHRH